MYIYGKRSLGFADTPLSSASREWEMESEEKIGAVICVRSVGHLEGGQGSHFNHLLRLLPREWQ